MARGSWDRSAGACKRVRTDGGLCFTISVCRSFKRRVTARELTLGPEIFGPCRSKAVEDPCRVSFVKL